MEVGVGPVQLGGAGWSVEGVQLHVQGVGAARLTQLEERLALRRRVLQAPPDPGGRACPRRARRKRNPRP
eukprot:6531568-Alexandrium_andersonii.AAC.1